MYSAKEARQRCRTTEEYSELSEIAQLIDEACVNKKRKVYFKVLKTELVRDILLDNGYKIHPTLNNEVVIRW